jgi:hypothetical protein
LGHTACNTRTDAFMSCRWGLTEIDSWCHCALRPTGQLCMPGSRSYCAINVLPKTCISSLLQTRKAGLVGLILGCLLSPCKR